MTETTKTTKNFMEMLEELILALVLSVYGQKGEVIYSSVDSALEALEAMIEPLTQYVVLVADLTVKEKIWRAKYDGSTREGRDNLSFYLERAAEDRYLAFDRVVLAISKINGLSCKLGLEPMFWESKYGVTYEGVASQVYNFVDEAYFNGQPGGFEAAVKKQIESEGKLDAETLLDTKALLAKFD